MKRDKFGYCVLALGVVGLILRKALYTVAVDSRGLLVRPHPLELALWVLTLAAAGLALTAEHVRRPARPGVQAEGCVLGAVGMLLACQELETGFPLLLVLLKIAAPLSACALALAGWRCWKGKKPLPWLWAVVCLVLVVRLVAAYQTWSREPQMMDYLFSLLASLCMAAFAYQQAAWELGMPKAFPWRLRFGLLAGYFGLVAGAGKQTLPFYTAMSCGILLMLLSGEETPC